MSDVWIDLSVMGNVLMASYLLHLIMWEWPSSIARSFIIHLLGCYLPDKACDIFETYQSPVPYNNVSFVGNNQEWSSLKNRMYTPTIGFEKMIICSDTTVFNGHIWVSEPRHSRRVKVAHLSVTWMAISGISMASSSRPQEKEGSLVSGIRKNAPSTFQACVYIRHIQ